MRADEITTLIEARRQQVKVLCVDIGIDEAPNGQLHELKTILAGHPYHRG